MSPAGYPLSIQSRLDRPGRWLWLVKWFLLIPHYIVLVFLWLAFVIVTVVAFFAILFTTRYPRSLFDFNVGVLRWSWRVNYYGYAALGTDRYPPFTLADVPDYPARLDVAYPERLNRWLPLVKWLLAIPHYIVLVVLGIAAFVAVVIAWFAILITGRYPRALFDFVVGVGQWGLRVGAYAFLLVTDRYPPFSLK